MQAQSYANYNRDGDEALSKDDYRLARMHYNTGIEQCDLYSIQKIVEIWRKEPSMQAMMLRNMLNCFNCLKTHAEAGTPEAIFLLRDFYNEGIGIEKDSVLAIFWHIEYGKTQGYVVDPPDIIKTKVPRKSLLSNKFCSFLAYTYSPTMPLGFTAGVYFDNIGSYVSFRKNFKSFSAPYECNNEKVPVIEIESPLYKFNGEHWHSRMITGGLLFPVVKNQFFISTGGGYGKRNYYREIISDNPFPTGNKSEWCINTEASYEGLTLETGGMFIWKKLTMVGGFNSTKFKDFDVYFGLGLTF